MFTKQCPLIHNYFSRSLNILNQQTQTCSAQTRSFDNNVLLNYTKHKYNEGQARVSLLSQLVGARRGALCRLETDRLDTTRPTQTVSSDVRGGATTDTLPFKGREISSVCPRSNKTPFSIFRL